jgi:hypothetical protein
MFVLYQEYEAAIAQIIRLLARSKLQVTRTFDLKSACADRPGGICPHHGTAPCTCQMTVLLIYDQNDESGAPVGLTVHGCDGQTWLSGVDIPQQQADPQLETRIIGALMSECTYSEQQGYAPSIDIT